MEEMINTQRILVGSSQGLAHTHVRNGIPIPNPPPLNLHIWAYSAGSCFIHLVVVSPEVKRPKRQYI